MRRYTRKNINVLNTDVIQVLDTLSASYQLGIITNGIHDLQMGKICRCGIQNRFKHIVISEDVGNAKPKSEIFYTALDKFKCSAENAIMIGDSLSNDIGGANHVGMKTVYLNNAENKELQNVVADYTVSRLREVMNILSII